MVPADHFLKQALIEEGIDAHVTQHTTDESNNIELSVYKNIGGTNYTYHDTITIPADIDEDIIHKETALAAIEIAEEIKETFRSVYTWGDERVDIYYFDTLYAHCAVCHRQLSLDEAINESVHMDAECTNPVPQPRKLTQTVLTMEPGHRDMLNMYLLGALQSQCNHRNI